MLKFMPTSVIQMYYQYVKAKIVERYMIVLKIKMKPVQKFINLTFTWYKNKVLIFYSLLFKEVDKLMSTLFF